MVPICICNESAVVYLLYRGQSLRIKTFSALKETIAVGKYNRLLNLWFENMKCDQISSKNKNGKKQ